MALIKAPSFTRYNRFGSYIGRVKPLTATHKEGLNGTDELTLLCKEDVAQGERIVWPDRDGIFREHIVDAVKRMHDKDGSPLTEAVCINSIAELWDDWIDDVRPSGSINTILTSLLQNTRWIVGDTSPEVFPQATYYHTTVREALADFADSSGLELYATITVVHDQIAERKIHCVAKRGSTTAKRFTWTKDIIGITRKVANTNPKTRIYGYGKGVETDAGGYGRRLTFGDINGGLNYVEDVSATKIFGHPGKDGKPAPAVDKYINEQCEDATQLLAETRDYLARASQPSVSYEASVIDLEAYGRDWEKVRLGDMVSIIDKEFSEEGLRLNARISEIKRDLLGGDTTITFGNIVNSMADYFQSVSTLQRTSEARGAIPAGGVALTPAWLAKLQHALHEQFFENDTYRVESFAFGVVYSNIPIDKDTAQPITKPNTTAWAISISSAGLRLASSVSVSNEWQWITLAAGTTISDNLSNVVWDLATGKFIAEDLTVYSISSSDAININTPMLTIGDPASSLATAITADITIPFLTDVKLKKGHLTCTKSSVHLAFNNGICTLCTYEEGKPNEPSGN